MSQSPSGTLRWLAAATATKPDPKTRTLENTRGRQHHPVPEFVGGQFCGVDPL
jgi:hypothetical protein